MNNQNRDIMPGETMFEYLKRKKRFLLEKTVGMRQPPTARTSLHQKSFNQSMDNDRTKREQFQDKTRRDDSRECSSSRLTARDKNQATTRRNSIVQQTRKPLSRSFIQMISPIRSKSPIPQAQKSTAKDVSVPKKDRQNYTRKMLNQNINLMRDTIQSQLKAGRSLKQKAHLLFLDLRPFFRHLQNCGQSGLQRKTQEIKGKVRAIESIFKEFNTQAHHNSIDQFYMHFSQYLNELDAHAKAQIVQNRENLTSQISTAKDREIYELKDINEKYERQIAILTKKYSKLQRSYEEMLYETQLKLSEKQQKYEQKINNLENQLMETEQTNKQLLQQVKRLKQSIKDYEQQRKKMITQRVKFEQQCLNTITRVKTQQQEFLLNQIVVLKKQFNADISKMAELYKIKEDDLHRKIKTQQFQIQKYKKMIAELMQSNKKLDETAAAVQAQSLRIKKQNECLGTDMHRINEQLYQHWLALKDIKNLSQRLDIFNKFKKIYEELVFNQQLFL